MSSARDHILDTNYLRALQRAAISAYSSEQDFESQSKLTLKESRII
ncbi:hypothetical protein [Leuconostoc mesenteroides]|nr:hypothetical protein [Leuconostoc mesenteroides]MBZ1520899.1 hypothetical protein [Leuconostoc mesenteroides]MCI2167780.1 hypothetical protein [Leuconostoc mesenteroides]